MTDAPTAWWLVRHAPTDNPGRMVYGALDLDVILPAPAMFEALSAMLPEDPVWLVTPLSRTRRTLDEILRARGVSREGGRPEIHVEPAFAEQNFGAWEGRPSAEVWDEIRHEEVSWPADIRPPDGETFSEVAARVGAAAADWSARLRGRTVVAVLHSGSIRGFLAAAMGGPPAAALSYVVDTLSVTRCDDLGGLGWRVGFVNRLPSPPPQ